ncbi:hypothetical protein KI387_006037, partial [Taxus chinensis]
MAIGAVAERSNGHAHAHQARLQKIVLSWDYFQLFKTSKARNIKNDEGSTALRKVSSSFKDINDYLSVFEPLLLEEIKAQIIRGGEEPGAMDPQAVLSESCEKANEFYTATIRVETSKDFGENDLLLLSKEKLSSLSTILREYTALQSVGSLPFADLIISAQTKKIESNASWNIPKPLMECLESNHNESQLEAIQAGLSRNPIVLIQGPPGTGKTQTILGILGAVLHAIPARMPSKGDTLTVQHRPELSFGDKFESWMKASPWMIGMNPRDMIMPMDGDDGFYPTTGNDFKPEVVAAKRKHRVHVLVCAPSNSALDEIVLRLMNI